MRGPRIFLFCALQVLGQTAMIQTDNQYPNTARIYSGTFTGNADMPFDFFMSRYREAYVQETLAFVDCLVEDKPAPCSGTDGLIALLMSIAAGISAEERRWVSFSELAPELCKYQGSLPGNSFSEAECMVAIVDEDSGALNLQGLKENPDFGLSGGTSDADADEPPPVLENSASVVDTPVERKRLRDRLTQAFKSSKL